MDKKKAKKKYILDMFPYPSGDGLHVGHVESYTATDILSRFYRMKGEEVLHPQGWDAFGLPAENYAIKTKIHPAETTQKAIATFKSQMNKLGFSYDWSREINSSDPKYYKWTQWFFLLLYKNGYAYRGKANVNFCPKCQTVLANEQVINGKCERCESEVTQKDLEQWFFRITDFIEDSGKTSGLISGLDKVDWPESTKAAQKNWIGRSEGTLIKFPIVIASEAKQSHANNSEIATSPSAPRNDKKYLEVFTTRLDTIYGCTYCVVAPEHEIIADCKLQITNYEEIEKYIIVAQNKTELERMEEKNKTGVEIKGMKAVSPFTKEEVPIFVADYVLGHYGTGAVMAVPAHDERDWEFAKKYQLQIIEVVKSKDNKPAVDKNAFTDDGILINSEKYSGLTSEKAREEMVKWLEENNLGSRKINYKLRDWLVSRQRYWGAPIPIIYCRKCWENSKSEILNPKQIKNSKSEKFQTTIIDNKEYAIIPVLEKDLPIVLPDDVDFNPTGESPLVHSKKFHNVKCPVCGGKACRESDTMDTFVCSSWYYFRYADPKNEKEFASKDLIKKWLPVDIYVGGAEHVVLHLLYSRFFTKVLYKLGYIDFDEPFLKLRHQGTILGEDNYKMSKSRGNVINPDDVVKEYGADALRMFEMFMGPLEDMKPWNTKGIVGIKRFLDKIERLKKHVIAIRQQAEKQSRYNYSEIAASPTTPRNDKILNLIHKTIKKVTEDIENLKFNTAISQMMILTNEMDKQETIPITNYELLITLLSPFAPHTAEELWSKIGHKESILKQKWPTYDPKLIKDEEIELVIQVNGKVRDRIKACADISEAEAKKLAMESQKVAQFIAGKTVKKAIFVKGKLINLAV